MSQRVFILEAKLPYLVSLWPCVFLARAWRRAATMFGSAPLSRSSMNTPARSVRMYSTTVWCTATVRRNGGDHPANGIGAFSPSSLGNHSDRFVQAGVAVPQTQAHLGPSLLGIYRNYTISFGAQAPVYLSVGSRFPHKRVRFAVNFSYLLCLALARRIVPAQTLGFWDFGCTVVTRGFFVAFLLGPYSRRSISVSESVSGLRIGSSGERLLFSQHE
jgi:hypothetical protein